MRQELDLIENLLRDVVARHDGSDLRGSELLVEGRDDATLVRHLRLLIAADYLRGQDRNTLGVDDSAHIVVTGVTWQGRHFVDAAREAVIWERTQRFAAERSSVVSAALLSEIAFAISLKLIGT